VFGEIVSDTRRVRELSRLQQGSDLWVSLCFTWSDVVAVIWFVPIKFVDDTMQGVVNVRTWRLLGIQSAHVVD